MKPKPAPATPAATPMAGKHLPIVSTNGRFLSCSCGFTIGTIDTSANARQITEGCAYLFAGHVAALQPAAAQPQRESEPMKDGMKEFKFRGKIVSRTDNFVSIESAQSLQHTFRVEELNGESEQPFSPQTDSQEPR